jgi:hypothetical protein
MKGNCLRLFRLVAADSELLPACFSELGGIWQVKVLFC